MASNAVEKVRGEEWVRTDPVKRDEHLLEVTRSLNAKQLALLTSYLMNGRNLSAAARAVGYNPSYAHQLWKSSPIFQTAADYVDEVLSAEDKEWAECLPDARQTMRSLMRNSKDDKVRYLAAKDIADRAEGKPVAKVDMQVRDERPSISDGEMQLAFSLMQKYGMGFPEAVNWIRNHPEETQRWIAGQREMEEKGGITVIDGEEATEEREGG